MKRDTARAILLAAALMTLQALLLSVLAASSALATTVYRCAPRHTGNVGYQAHICPEGSTAPLKVDDARSPAQQSQARQNHARQVAWLEQRDGQNEARATPKRRHKRRVIAPTSSLPSQAAVPLTSHRIGQRPFEHLGQQVSQPSRVQKRKRNRYEITARTPTKPRQAATSAERGVSPSP